MQRIQDMGTDEDEVETLTVFQFAYFLSRLLIVLFAQISFCSMMPSK